MRKQKSNSRGGHLNSKKQNRFKVTRETKRNNSKRMLKQSNRLLHKKKLNVKNILKLILAIILILVVYQTFTTMQDLKDVNNSLDKIINTLDGIQQTQTELENKQIELEEREKALEISKAEKKAAEEKAAKEAEEKAVKEAEEKAKQEAIRVAQSKQVTSRGSTTVRATTGTKAEYQSYAHDLCINTYGWTENDFDCLVKLWNRESGWNPNAHNSSSGAHGIPQSLPASKMASEGDDYYTNGKTQIRWGLKYIKNRYGTPSAAWAHSQQKGWY